MKLYLLEKQLTDRICVLGVLRNNSQRNNSSKKFEMGRCTSLAIIISIFLIAQNMDSEVPLITHNYNLKRGAMLTGWSHIYDNDMENFELVHNVKWYRQDRGVEPTHTYFQKAKVIHQKTCETLSEDMWREL